MQSAIAARAEAAVLPIAASPDWEYGRMRSDGDSLRRRSAAAIAPRLAAIDRARRRCQRSGRHVRVHDNHPLAGVAPTKVAPVLRWEPCRDAANPLSNRAVLLPPLDPERHVGAAPREPLRAQLRRGARPPQRPHRRAGGHRLAPDAARRDRSIEARPGRGAALDAAARALF